MRLIPWRHPKTRDLRLYVPVEAVAALKNRGERVKLWFQASSGSTESWSCESQGLAAPDVAEAAHEVLTALSLNDQCAWSDLVACITPRPQEPSTQKQSEIAAIRLEVPLVMSVSDKEPEELAPMLAEHPRLEVLPNVPLRFGSVRVVDSEGAQLIMWRVSGDPSAPGSLVKLLRDGSWFEMADKLSEAMTNSDMLSDAVIVLEGDLYQAITGVSHHQIDGALAYTLGMQRVSIVSTQDLGHTAAFMVRLAGQFAKALQSPAQTRRSKPTAVSEYQRFILESLPGVSRVIAEALLAEFGDVASVMAASEQQLLSVPGLGRTKVKRILRVLSSH